jgi:Rod binding domain-containing protein
MQVGDLQKPLRSPFAPLSDARLEDARRAAQAGGTAESARQFEQLFATMLVRELRRSMPQSPFGQGPGAEVYEGWFDEHLGRALALQDALGISRLVGRSLVEGEPDAVTSAPTSLAELRR